MPSRSSDLNCQGRLPVERDGITAGTFTEKQIVNQIGVASSPWQKTNPTKNCYNSLNEFEVEYLIVGGFAVMKYGEPGCTTDLDVWAHNSAQNSLRLVEALKKFGAPGPAIMDEMTVFPSTIGVECKIYSTNGYLAYVDFP